MASEEPITASSFSELAEKLGLDPSSRWIGGYVEHAWNRRGALTAYLPPLEGLPVLEFGCNIGATAIVLGRLGANVTAVDVDANKIALAKANAADHGQTISFRHVPDTRALPFPTNCFKAITCVSVLEYVERKQLQNIMCELDRVLAPGGVLLIQGTSSRLAVKEVHSGRWFVNWLPYPVLARLQRGVWPWQISPRGYENLAFADKDRNYLSARLPRRSLALAATLAHFTGQSLGYFLPSIYLALRKPN